jgi:hypothetical protein
MAWSSLLMLVPCSNGMVFFTYSCSLLHDVVFFTFSCSMLQWRGLLYLFLFHAPLARSSSLFLVRYSIGVRGLLYLFLFHAPMAWYSLLFLVTCSNGVVFFTFLVPCSIDVVFFAYSCYMLQWYDLLYLFLFHAPMAWSIVLMLIPCSIGVFYFAYAWPMLQGHGRKVSTLLEWR